MNKRIISAIEKYNMLSEGDTVLLAVSGGADSMLMLDFFVRNREHFGVNLKVAHIEHGIRGQESIDDALFVERCCKKNNIQFNILHINAPQEAKEHGLGVEEYSRNRRYEFFSTIDCDKIATAHNLTDNVETVIYRLARGTGLKGICGIPAKRGKIIRPLIEISSDDIRSYCDCSNIEYRIDSTNKENDYSRNSIRNNILPLLSNINTKFEDNIFEFISDINEDNLFIESAVDSSYDTVFDGTALLISQLKLLDVSIQKRVIKKYFNDNSLKLDRLHLNQVLGLINKNGRIQICKNYFAVSDKKYLRAAEFKQADNSFDFVSQILNINEFRAKNIDFCCDYDKINGSVVVRSRKEGDTILPKGRNCTKSLKKLFNELAIPVEKRSSVCVICDDNGVIGFYYGSFHCTADRVKIDETTKNVITIKFPVED